MVDFFSADSGAYGRGVESGLLLRERQRKERNKLNILQGGQPPPYVQGVLPEPTFGTPAATPLKDVGLPQTQATPVPSTGLAAGGLPHANQRQPSETEQRALSQLAPAPAKRMTRKEREKLVADVNGIVSALEKNARVSEEPEFQGLPARERSRLFDVGHFIPEEAAQWYREKAIPYFEQNPDQLVSAKRDPLAFYFAQQPNTPRGDQRAVTLLNQDQPASQAPATGLVQGGQQEQQQGLEILQPPPTVGEEQAGAFDTTPELPQAAGLGDKPNAPPVQPPKSPPIYTSDPSVITTDMKNTMQDRRRIAGVVEYYNREAAEYYRLAEISRISGDFDSYTNYRQQHKGAYLRAQEVYEGVVQSDRKLMYLQGMQGLSDLRFGDGAKASAVWSQAVGKPVQIHSRTDGKYDVTVSGQTYKQGLSLAEVSELARLAFDRGFRDLVAGANAESQKIINETNKEFRLQELVNAGTFNAANANAITRITVATITANSKITVAEIGREAEQLKSTGGGIKTLAEGSYALILRDGKWYLVTPNGQEIVGFDGETTKDTLVQEIILPKPQTGRNLYTDALKKP